MTDEGRTVDGFAAPALTPAQLRVLRALSDGRTMKQVAAELSVSVQTIKNHCREAYVRLEVNGLVGAYARLGWLRPSLDS